MAVTIYAIAKRAGVSSSTVARVLRGDVKSLSGPSAERAARIRHLAKEMGYQRNWRAQAFSRCKTHAVGLFHTHTAWIHEGTMGEIAGGFTMGMQDHGYHVVIVPYDENGDWRELLRDGRLDGIAISHYLPDDARDAVEESGLPRVLLMDKTIPTWPCSVTDDEGGAYTATRRLIDLGHRRISMYLHDSIRKHFSVDDRHAGYEKAMKKAGLQEYIQFWHLTEERLPEALFGHATRPTAVLCYCHLEAMAVYLAAWRRGVKIPDELSVIAFNDLPTTQYMTPPLTTMGFNTSHIGRVGANLLVKQIETDDAEPERCHNGKAYRTTIDGAAREEERVGFAQQIGRRQSRFASIKGTRHSKGKAARTFQLRMERHAAGNACKHFASTRPSALFRSSPNRSSSMRTTGILKLAQQWRLAAVLAALCSLAISNCREARATGNVAMALDGMIVNNSGGGQTGWGGFGRFSYGAITVGESAMLGRYGAFTIAEPGSGGSGVGVNFALGSPALDSPRDSFAGPITPVTSAMFPLLDRGTFGVNFDPTQYVAELVYKPLAGNTATQLNMTLDTTDGFDAAGNRSAEQWQWAFPNLVTNYASAPHDADGFAVIRNNGGVLTQATSGFTGQSFMYQSGNPVGDASPDFNDFEGGPLPVPNGVVQLHLQTLYGGGSELIDNWEIKALRIVKLTPDAREVARLDGHSGFSLRFGSPFQRNPDTLITVGGTSYDPPVTDQVSRFNATGFTNIVLNTDDDDAFGGLAIFQSAATTVFDGTNAQVEVKAKLTAPLGAGQADHIVLVLKDKDGNGTTGAGDLGGDEYHFNLLLNQFNTSSMTSVSIPLNTFAPEIAREFATGGDGLLTNFNLYYLGLQIDLDAGLVDLEIESIRVLLPGLSGDYDQNGLVDGNDFLLWQRTLGAAVATGSGADGDKSGVIDAGDLAVWKTGFGTSGAAGSSGAIPEPAAATLAVIAFAWTTRVGRLGTRRGRPSMHGHN